MSKKVTSKRANSAKSVSHAHNRKNRKQNLNFQYFTINGVRIKTTAREARIFNKIFNKEKKS